MNPDTFNDILTIVLTLFGLIGSYAAARVAQRTGLDIEQTHIDRIKAAVQNVAIAAMADGRTDAAEITRLSLAYLARHLPDAVGKVKPSSDAISTIVKAQIEAWPIDLTPLDARM
ncbi:hypothetical protein SAMN05444339_10295 [Loktanella atrilutea]|uniref:Uncharacterized protein n=1 Tax=Loktanella atrilutea TaxID=366533 RepID=A0A1M4WFA0_LOKAT|nr:hypothetical protein [Loktanella atrilutea]SHE79894.1 hypothetical protein SAMN05444339_10295 [Loktanella atrilutea]